MTGNRAPKFDLHWALLFVLLSAILVGAGWHTIHMAGPEYADFAANSLLIQDAKRLHLIYGNYSRVGFNHPGPAILYVHAFGEMLLYDWLHLVPTPFAGQVVASFLYNAAWMTLLFALVRRTAGQAQALLFVAAFVLVALGIDSAIVNGMWFPDLYFFPYAAMLVSIAPLAHGRADTLKPLAVSGGFLINGHASFIPMLALMLVFMLAANWLVSRKDRSLRILSRAWFTTHRRALLAAIGILFLFLVPLLIATVKDFPGPLYDYVHYGRLNKGNPLPDALRFVLLYWGVGKMHAAGLLLAFALAVLLLGTRPARHPATPAAYDFTQAARGLGIAFLASSAALLYYAKVGIDDLGQVYVGLFYYSVPAMSAAVLALFLCRAVPDARRARAALAMALGALVVAWPWLREPPIYTWDYGQPFIADLYGKLRALPGSGRIVLDLEQDPETWGKVSGSVLGVQAMARRAHLDLVCINEHWGIANTRPARCRPDEVASNRRYRVRMADALDPALGEPDIEANRLALYRVGAAPRPLAFVTVKEQPQVFKQILGKGWSTVEADFVWTDGPVARIELPPDPARGRILILDLGSYLRDLEHRQHVEAWVDGRLAGQMVWAFDAPRRRFPIDLGPAPGDAKHIELRIAEPVSPKELGRGEDTRRLGLSLYGIKKASE